MAEPAKQHLALAIDVPLPQGLALFGKLRQHVGVAKVGLSLFLEHGPAAVVPFVAAGARVFLDLKLHDIPNTVELAAQRAAALGVSFLTVHASGGAAMLQAAVRGAREGAASVGAPAPVILAVTVLTSMDEAGLRQVGVPGSTESQVARLAELAKRAGVGGLVCSAREVSGVRRAVGPDLVLCTPGIRPTGVVANDQARVETPTSAIRAGADLLVVGRPIYEASDPLAAAAALEAEVSAALAAR